MMILRAALAAALTVGILITPIVAEAQPAAKVPRIGYLVTGSLESPETRVALDAFRQGLRERGYVEGQNILIEYRAADGKIERFPGLATELARLKVDLILAANTPAARAAQQATTTIPIVVPVIGDPVGDGLVTSLTRPGGNVTGLTYLGVGPQASGAAQASPPQGFSGRGPLASRRFQRAHDPRHVEGDRGRGTDSGSATSTRGGAGSQRVRPRILHDDQRARRCPHRVSEHDAL